MQRASNSLNDTPEARLLALRFGPFELDVRSGELRRNGTTVRLQPQPLEVGVAGRALAQVVGEDVARRLGVLADRPGQVVVPVDHGVPRQHRLRARERILRRAERRRARGEERERRKEEARNERTSLMLRLRHTRRSLADEDW